MLKVCFFIEMLIFWSLEIQPKELTKIGKSTSPSHQSLRQAIASDHRWYPQLQQGIECWMPGLLSNKWIHMDSYLDARDSYSSHMVNQQSYIVYSSIILPFLVLVEKKRERCFFTRLNWGTF